MVKFYYDAERWERTREAGRARFVWRAGVLGFGLTAAVCCAALALAWPGERSVWAPILAWPLAGYVWGRVMWWWCERRRARQQVLPAAAVR